MLVSLVVDEAHHGSGNGGKGESRLETGSQSWFCRQSASQAVQRDCSRFLPEIQFDRDTTRSGNHKMGIHDGIVAGVVKSDNSVALAGEELNG